MNVIPQLPSRPQRYAVGHGMTLYALQTDRFKVGFFSLALAKQIRENLSAATALLCSVLQRGTEKYPSLGQINERLDELYASSLLMRNSRIADREILSIAVECLDSRYLDIPDGTDILDGCIEMMAQMLLHPLTDEDGLLVERLVESEREHRRDRIRAEKNNPTLWAILRKDAILYEGEPCGLPLNGTVEQIMALTREQLRDCHREWLEDGEMIFFYVGPAAPKHVCSLIRRHFAEFQPATLTPCPHTTVVRHAERVKEVTEEMAVSQGQLLLGFRTDVTVHDPDYYAMVMACEIFGGSPISKLFMEVRERKSLCYSISSTYASAKGVLNVSCGIDPKTRDIAYAEILHQWEQMKQGNITEEELDAAKRSLDNHYRTIADSPPAIEGFYYSRLLEGIDMAVEDCRAGFAAVTREDIMRVAAGVTLDTVYFLKGTCPDEPWEEDDDAE